MSDLFEAFVGQEHTRDNWLAAWSKVRARTALEPHGVELVDIDDERIVLCMTIGDHARQPMGLLHGGISMMLAESAASMHACWKANLLEVAPVGIEINGSHLRSATEGTVEVVGTVIRRSATIVHHQVEILHVDTGKLLSTIRVTNLYRPHRT